jgi:tRNA U55 pseudouridine synthase TruB
MQPFTRRLSHSLRSPLLFAPGVFLPHSLDGLLLPLVKPVGPTSQQCLTRLKRLIGGRKLEVFESPGGTRTVKVGYAGTLDPLASGLLICGFGSATRELIAFR